MMLSGKRILLILSGGIAAYKTLELTRRLRERGATVRAIMTRSAQQFLAPLSVSAITGDKVYCDLFDLTDEAEMGHIELSRDADLLVVAPATAHILARMAAGQADDLATTALLATDKPVLVAPAMNVRMWTHPATQRNLATLREDGILFVGPNDGDMACGEFGPGRMAEPEEILAAISEIFDSPPLLAGCHVMVTAGPTHEPIDPVRYIANRSSGKQGYAIAAAAASAGARVTLISGPVHLPAPAGVDLVKVETAGEMMEAARAALPADVAIMAAAVADWRVGQAETKKIKKSGDAAPGLTLVENVDILATIGHLEERRPRLVIGFAAETDDLVANARVKLTRKGADWIVANDVSPEYGVMGGDDNSVQLVTSGGLDPWPKMTKSAVAARLIAAIAEWLDEHQDLSV